jgi:hypothetical protein
MQMSDLQTEFGVIIDDIVTPALKEACFRKSALNFHHALGELTQVFSVQKSQWNSKDSVKFTFHIGFLNSDIFKEFHDEEPPKIPKEYHCLIKFRLGHIIHKCDYWYELNRMNDPSTLQKEIKTDFQDYVIPIFGRYQTLSSLRELCDKYDFIYLTMGNLPRFVWLMKIGEVDAATRLIRETYSKELTPQGSVHIIRYPDGRTEQTTSEPRINQQYIQRVKVIAERYNVSL